MCLFSDRDASPSRGPPSRTFGTPSTILQATVCVTAWNMWDCYFSTARVLAVCHNMLEYASLIHPDLIHHKAQLITHLLLLFGLPSLLSYFVLRRRVCQRGWASVGPVSRWAPGGVCRWPATTLNASLNTKSAPSTSEWDCGEKTVALLCFVGVLHKLGAIKCTKLPDFKWIIYKN